MGVARGIGKMIRRDVDVKCFSWLSVTSVGWCGTYLREEFKEHRLVLNTKRNRWHPSINEHGYDLSTKRNQWHPDIEEHGYRTSSGEAVAPIN